MLDINKFIWPEHNFIYMWKCLWILYVYVFVCKLLFKMHLAISACHLHNATFACLRKCLLTYLIKMINTFVIIIAAKWCCNYSSFIIMSTMYKHMHCRCVDIDTKFPLLKYWCFAFLLCLKWPFESYQTSENSNKILFLVMFWSFSIF